MQNLTRFQMTSESDFVGEYLRNGWRYSKSDKYFIDSDFSRVRRRKSGELWPTNYRDLDVESYSLKSTFFKDHISACRGCCAAKFLHMLQNDQVFSAHTPPGTRVSRKICLQLGPKIGLKFSEFAPITLG